MVTGKRIYTANPKAPTAETVAILGDQDRNRWLQNHKVAKPCVVRSNNQSRAKHYIPGFY